MPGPLTRTEHLQWAKARALACLEPPQRGLVGRFSEAVKAVFVPLVQVNRVTSAWHSFVCDLGQHPETRTHHAIPLGMLAMLAGTLRTAADMRLFLDSVY